MALHSQILKGYGHIELAQEKDKQVSSAIKILAQVKSSNNYWIPLLN